VSPPPSDDPRGSVKQFQFDAAAARERDEEERPRVDAFLAACDAELTRSQVKRLIEEGDVSLNGAVVDKPSTKLRDGDRVEVRIRPPVAVAIAAESIPLTILHEDPHLIVIDKPAGLVVHPAPGHSGGTLVNALLAVCTDLSGIGGELRPGIVHRLDKDTSGVMVVSKSDAAHNALSALFKAKTLLREYIGVAAPAPGGERGTVRTLYGRHPVHRKKFSSKVAEGKTAVTHWTLTERFAGGAAMLRFRLETGRTHQIRVHASDSGWPLIGDPLYGRRGQTAFLTELAGELGRQALHAARLDFTHPITGEALRFETAPPADLQRLLQRLRDGR
jgi:23S rRNA pseudouridine1911/1915/1917 synthase